MSELQNQMEELREQCAIGENEYEKKGREVIIEMYPQILDPDYDPKKKKQKVNFIFCLL